MMKAIKRNGITIAVENWSPWRKLPVLTVRFDDSPTTANKVASFNSEKTANWFCEIMEEFFAD